ncbi:MAG: ferric reductase [Bifidobacterium sp.]|nr:ferric reductase [Bifidobacterium sp.]
MTKKRNPLLRLPVFWLSILVLVPAPFVAVLAVFINPIFREVSMLPIALGVIAYIWMLESVYLSCRPHWLDRLVGLPDMYLAHGLLAVFAFAISIIHRLELPTFGLAKTFGEIAFWSLLAMVVFSVLFMTRRLTDLIAPIRSFLMAHGPLIKHEIAVWLHRLVLITVGVTCVHFHLISYIVTVWPFIILCDAATIVVLGYYILFKIREHRPELQGQVISREMLADNICELTIHVPGINRNWETGDFAFLRLPDFKELREYHPFSMADAPNKDDNATFVIRGDGDFTILLPVFASPGARVDLQRPFGRYHRFIKEHGGGRPLVLYAGGTGIVPLLAVLDAYGSATNGRRITLAYSAKNESELIHQSQLRRWAERTGNTIMLKVGRFNDEELRAAVTPKAVYLLAGPTPMYRSVRHILRHEGVAASDIYHESFSF